MAPNFRPLRALNGRLIRSNINAKLKVIFFMNLSEIHLIKPQLSPQKIVGLVQATYIWTPATSKFLSNGPSKISTYINYVD